MTVHITLNEVVAGKVYKFLRENFQNSPPLNSSETSTTMMMAKLFANKRYLFDACLPLTYDLADIYPTNIPCTTPF